MISWLETNAETLISWVRMADGVRQVWVSISSCHVSSFVTMEKLINLSELSSWSEVKLLSRIRLFATPWTVAYHAPSMGFSRILEWVAISFSSGSSQPRDQTWVSCIAGRRFTVWATREAQMICKMDIIPIVLLRMLGGLNMVICMQVCIMAVSGAWSVFKKLWLLLLFTLQGKLGH